MSSQNYTQNILNDKNELHMSSQKDTQNTQTVWSKYIKTDLSDEKGRVYGLKLPTETVDPDEEEKEVNDDSYK